MIKSMTGFGCGNHEGKSQIQVWEVRSVNGRHLDIKWRMPSQARYAEVFLEKAVRAQASRGRLEISLTLQPKAQDNLQILFNAPMAKARLEAVEKLAQSQGHAFLPDYNMLLNISSLWENQSEGEGEDFAQELALGLEKALTDWNSSRIQEGSALSQDLCQRFQVMKEWLAQLEKSAPQIKIDRLNAIRDRLKDVLQNIGSDLDEGRYLQEMVVLADKQDVSEELTRLTLHLARLQELLSLGQDAGRKLDFTLQECFREINTCGNKIQDAQISMLVVDFKNELEKCREQVQNLE